ncbi:helix-turn-helix domain-containing protein [Streptomyces virginiae]|uniref:helix-turn-helix domain-containing protein n=1 Tax=Streptomyces virginiae TaxID=1961 RepID=UPI0037B306B6
MPIPGTSKRGITAEELGALVGATKSQITAYENGRTVPDPKRVRKLADALGVDPRRLMRPGRYRWTVADLRRSVAMTAEEVSKGLELSLKPYRRFEQQGIVPARRPQFLDQLASVLGLSYRVLDRALDNIPAVVERRLRTAELTRAMAQIYIPRPGIWRGPDANDEALVELASLYGRPVQRTRRVLAYELGELRQLNVQAMREEVVANFDPNPARQADAAARVHRVKELTERQLARIPGRLEAFHRRAQPSDAWQVMVSLYNLEAWHDGRWVWAADLAHHDTWMMLPPSLVTMMHIESLPMLQLTSQGIGHIRTFGSLYRALHPGLARIKHSRGRSRAATSSQRGLPGETVTAYMNGRLESLGVEADGRVGGGGRRAAH